jgi:hypothetical protein
MVTNIVGTNVTYHPYNKFNELSGETRTSELDDFLKMKILVQNDYNEWKKTPIGEVYKFFPARLEDDTEDVYNEKVEEYLKKLMIEFRSFRSFRSRPSGGRKSGKSNKSKYLRTKLKRTRSKKINKRIKKRSCKRRR